MKMLITYKKHLVNSKDEMSCLNHLQYMRTAFVSAMLLLATMATMAQGTPQGVRIHGSVYGGGNVADVGGNTLLNLMSGTIGENVYGGGKGKQDEKDALGNITTPGIAPTVGDVLINVNGMAKADYESNTALYSTWELEEAEDPELDDYTPPYIVPDDKRGCAVIGSIFGCNNLNGTPLGDVKVHVFGTQKHTRSRIEDKSGLSDMPAPAEGKELTSLETLKYWIDEAENNDVAKATVDAAKTVYEQYKETAAASLSDDAVAAIEAQINALSAATNTAVDNNQYDVQAVYGGGNLAAYLPTKATNNDTTDDNDIFAEVLIDGCGRSSIRQVYGGGNAASTPSTSVTVYGTHEIEELFGGGNGYGYLDDANTIPNPGANIGFKDYHLVEDTYNTKEIRESDETFIANYVYGSGKATVNIYGGTIHRVFGGSNTKGNVRITAVTMLEDKSTCDFKVDEAYGGGKSAPMDATAQLHMACIPGLHAAYGGAQEANIQGDVTLNITNGTFDRIFGGNNISGHINGSITVNIEETGCKPIIIGELYGGGNRAAYSVYGYDESSGSYLTKEDFETLYAGKTTEELEALKQADPVINVKSFTSIGNIYGGGLGESAVMVGNPTVNINVAEGRWADAGTQFANFDDTGYKGAESKLAGMTANDFVTVVIPPHKNGTIGVINNVYGGGNAAMVIGDTHVNIGTARTIDFVTGIESAPPATGVDVKGASIVGNVFGGGNAAAVTGNASVEIGFEQNDDTQGNGQGDGPDESQTP